MNEKLFNRIHQIFSFLLLLTSAFLILDFFIPKSEVITELDEVESYGGAHFDEYGVGEIVLKRIKLKIGSFTVFGGDVTSMNFEGKLKLKATYFLDLVKSLKSTDGIIVPNYNIYIMLVFVCLVTSIFGCFKNISMNTRFNLILVWLFTLPFNAFLFYFILLK